MEITEVNIVPVDEGRLRARVSITFDHCFAIYGLKLIQGKKGYVLMMPQKKKGGKYVDIVHPIDTATRRMIEEKVFAAYQAFANEPVKRPVQK